MSDTSLNLSNETHHLPHHNPSIPSSPEPPTSPTLVEVSLPPALTAFPLTLVHNYPSPEYPPVSPTSAETILMLDPTINATIHATTFRLATTVRQRTKHYVQKLEEVSRQVEQLEQLNTQHNADNQQL